MPPSSNVSQQPPVVADPDPLSIVHPADRTAAEQAISRAFHSGVPQVITCRQLRADGRYVAAEFRADPGYPVSVPVEPMVQTPDEPWTAVDAPGETADAIRAARVIEQMHGAAFALDPTGRFTYATPIAQTSIAMTLEDLNRPLDGTPFLDGGDHGWKLGVHPDDYPGAASRLRQCMRSGEDFNYEYRVLRATGDFVWHRFSIRPTRDPSGRVTGWYGIGFDVDVQRKTDAALRERERELSQLVDMVPSHLWRLAPDGEPIFFNRRMVEYLGLDLDDISASGTSLLEILIASTVHPEEQAVFRDTLHRSLQTGDTFALRYRLLRHDGAYRWMSSKATPMRDRSGKVLQWYGLCHDIDDQIRAEQDVLKREQQLRRIVDTVPIAIWSFTSEGRVTYVSPQNREHLGVADLHFDDFAAISSAVVHPDDRPLTLAARTEAFRSGSAFSVRYRRLVNGTYRWTEGRAAPLRDEAGDIIQWYAVSMDVDDEVRAIAGLQESERQLRRLVDALPTQIWAAQADGEPSYLNRRLSEFVGLTLSDLDRDEVTRLQAAITGSVHPDDAEAVGKALAHSFSTGEPFAMKYRQRRSDGVYRWINGRAEPLRGPDGAIQQWYGVSFDIDDDVRTQDELRRTQERLATASQSASLAELSASIAHEVNQPLAAILANSNAAQRWLAADPPNVDRALKAVTRVAQDAEGASEVVGHIRALFRQTRSGRLPTHVDAVIEEARGLIAEEALRRRVVLAISVEPGLPKVSIDRVQIQQVLINLMKNGIEAMAAVTGERLLTLSARVGDLGVEIEVGDNGPGLTEPDRMFEPFYTTKEGGMGMGLAICRGIVESHGGRMWAAKREPQGARIGFALPLTEADE